MSRDSEKRMPKEVTFRNAVAMFRRKNAASTRKASTPKVGIFWIDDHGTMFAASVSLPDAEDYGEFKIFDGSHLDSWDKAIRSNPKWKDLQYEQIPRGRVVYRQDPKKPEFIVYMPEQISKYRGKVVTRFKLPSGYVRFNFDDEHYQLGTDRKEHQ